MWSHFLSLKLQGPTPGYDKGPIEQASSPTFYNATRDGMQLTTVE